MAQFKNIFDLDEIVTLYLLNQCEMTHKQVWEALTLLTDGEIKYNSNYVSGTLFRLCKSKSVNKYEEGKNRVVFYITDTGKDELQRRLQHFGVYDNILHPLTNRDDLPKISLLTPSDYEASFDSFLERSEYDNAENMIFALVRAAYKAGWCSAGGEPPQPKPLLQLLDKK